MIFVEGGKFTMGDVTYKDNPKHDVTVDAFYIGKFPVTQALYEKVMGKYAPRFKGDKRPVENVSWENAQIFFEKLEKDTGKKYRLPIEAEWECAARGGIHLKDNFKYAGGENLNEFGWYDDNSHGETKPVGMKMENQLGLFDMSGNILEWCEDWYNKDFYKNRKTENSWRPIKGIIHVVRGGAWNFSENHCSVYNAGNYMLVNFVKRVGFRCVLSN